MPFNPVALFVGVMTYFRRLWNFWGPRLTDRTFIGAMVANGVVLGVINPAHAQTWQLALWASANLILPIWDSHPAGEKISTSPAGIESEFAASRVDGDELSLRVRHAVRAELAAYAKA